MIIKLLFLFFSSFFCLIFNGQNNLVVNGALLDNALHIVENDYGETSKGLPYLDHYSHLSIKNFRGIFCYPYPDSLPFIALRYGFGFSPNSSQCMKKEFKRNLSELYGTFSEELIIGGEYNFKFTYFPYWGNCLLNDSISLFMLDINGKKIQELKVFIGNDTPFKYKKVSFDFESFGKAAFFQFYFHYNDVVNSKSMNLFNDSSILKRKYKIVSEKACGCCNCYTQDSFNSEVKMRENNPFVYYLISEFGCYSTYDSAKLCELRHDTLLLSNIFFKIDSDIANIQSIISRELELDGKVLLIKGFSDANSDLASDLKLLSLKRADSVKDLLNEIFKCDIMVLPMGSNYPIIQDPYKILNRRAEVYLVSKKFVNCKDISH